jgi:predicted Fe-S protein YdhL (DUF1289 family)
MSLVCKKKRQWKKHTDFDSGISRLQYVQLCMIEYIQDAQREEDNKADLHKPCLSYLNKSQSKKVFFTDIDTVGVKDFVCIGCNASFHEHIQWITYEHFNNAKSPVCRECFSEAYSCDTTTKSSSVAM